MRYDAADPDLQVWLWATIVDTTIYVNRRFTGSLAEEEIEAWNAEQKRWAHATGVPEGACPSDYAAFREYFASAVEQLQPSPDSVLIINALLPPRIALALRPLLIPFRFVTVGILSDTPRRQLGLGWSQRSERALSMIAPPGLVPS